MPSLETQYNRTDKEMVAMFERLSKPKPLLPLNIEQKRLKSFVYDSLPVKARPDIDNYRKFNPTDQLIEDSYGNFLKFSSPFVLKIIGKETDQPIFLMDKLQPHSLKELMIISAAPKTLFGIADHDKEARQNIFRIMSQFPQYAREQGLYPYVAFSYDPHTFDRESGQDEKRFHGHLIGRTQDEMENVVQKKVQLAQLALLRRRRLIDETTVLGSLIMYDYFADNSDLSSMYPIKPFTKKNCPSLLFELRDGWETLTSEAFDKDFLRLHEGLSQTFDMLKKVTTEGETTIWQRRNVKDIDELGVKQKIIEDLTGITWMSQESLYTFVYFLHGIKKHFSKWQIRAFQHPAFRDITTHVYPLADLCYSTAFFEENGRVYGVVRPQLFSDLGGAGVEYLEGTATKLKRGVNIYSYAEMEERMAFQQGFLKLF